MRIPAVFSEESGEHGQPHEQYRHCDTRYHDDTCKLEAGRKTAAVFFSVVSEIPAREFMYVRIVFFLFHRQAPVSGLREFRPRQG